MTSPEPDPRESRPAADPTDVPGLGPTAHPPAAPTAHPPGTPAAHPSGPLDMSKDPDRFDPTRDPLADAPYDPTVIGGPLDRSLDPDRYQPPGQGQTLTDLLGEGAHEDKRDNMQWAWGLISIVGFLLLVSFLFGAVLSPR